MLIKIQNYLPKFIIPRKGDLKPLHVININDKIILQSSRCHSILLPRHIELTDNNYIAIGLYFAEGNKRVSIKSKTKHSGEIAFANSYLDSIKCFLRLMEKFNIYTDNFNWSVDLNINYYKRSFQPALNYWIKRLNLKKSRMYEPHLKGVKGGRLSSNTSKFGCLRLSFASVIFRSVFLEFINRLFDEALVSEDSRTLALILQGYFAGDGHVSFDRTDSIYPRRIVEFLCNDPPLFNRLYLALEILGLTRLRQTFPEYTKTHTKSIRIYNKHDFDILHNLHIPHFVDYKSSTFSSLLEGYKIPKSL